jgi:anti-anti-sigma factor
VIRVEHTFNLPGRYAVVCVAGEVDIATVAAVEDGLRRAAAATPCAVVCDLRRVTFFAVAGLHCLEKAMDELERLGTPLHLVIGVNGMRSPVLRLALSTFPWPVHRSIDEAVSSALRSTNASHRS